MILDPKQHTIAVRAAAALHRPDCLCTSCQPHLPIAERHLAVISRDDRRLAIQAAMRQLTKLRRQHKPTPAP